MRSIGARLPWVLSRTKVKSKKEKAKKGYQVIRIPGNQGDIEEE
jgi:hypothetical protein